MSFSFVVRKNHDYVRCPLCGSSHLFIYRELKKEGTELLAAFKCRDCGLDFKLIAPGEKTLAFQPLPEVVKEPKADKKESK